MQAKALMLALALCAGACAGAAVALDSPRRGEWRPDHGRPDPTRPNPGRPDHGGPAVIIEPNIDLSRRHREDRNAAGPVMATIEGCVAGGVRLFIHCLRGRLTSVAIRRLEACLRSETIPDDPRRVAACLPAAGVY